MSCYRHIAIREGNFIKFRNECRQEYLRHHPDIKDENLSDDMLIASMINFYLSN